MTPAKTMTPIHEDQARRRRRARISQTELAVFLKCAISKISEYETRGEPLPWEQTAEDYENALAEAIEAKRRAGEVE